MISLPPRLRPAAQRPQISITAGSTYFQSFGRMMSAYGLLFVAAVSSMFLARWDLKRRRVAEGKAALAYAREHDQYH